MITKIYKYPIETTGEQEVMMPSHAHILFVQVQGNTPCLWARVDPDAQLVVRRILVFGTGHPIEGHPDYIGTYQLGSLVFHVYEGEPRSNEDG